MLGMSMIMGSESLGGSSLPGVFGFNNFNGSNLTVWLAAQAAVVSGASNTIFADYGDSTTAGIQSDATTSGLWSNAYPNVLATNMVGRGVNASNESYFGNNNVPNGGGTYAHYNPRAVVGTGWAPNATTSLGGPRWFQNSSLLGAFSFTPTVSIDSFDLYPVNSFGTTFNIDYDGGLPTLVTTVSGGSATITPAFTVSSTLGAHTINIKWAGAGGGAIMAGGIAYNSAVKQVKVVNAGIGSAATTQMADTTNAFSTLNALKSLAPTGSFILLGINDMIGSTSLATSQANLTTIINAAKLSGNPILGSPNPFNTSLGGNTNLAFQQSYAAMCKALAYSLNTPFIDIFNLMGGTLAAAQALGYISTDLTHPSQSGYAAIAGWLSTATAPGFFAR